MDINVELAKETLILKSVFVEEQESYESFGCICVLLNGAELYIYEATSERIRLYFKSAFPFLNKILIEFK